MKLASDCRGEAVFMEILRPTKLFVGLAEGKGVYGCYILKKELIDNYEDTTRVHRYT